MEKRNDIDTKMETIEKRTNIDCHVERGLKQSEYPEKPEISSIQLDSEQTPTDVFSNSNDPLNSDQEPAKETVNKRYGIGITGFDRIFSPLCNGRMKSVWIIFFLACTAAVIYQIIACVYQFYYATPGVTVSIVHRPFVPLPKVIVCPFEFFRENPVTESLYKQYKNHFNLTDSETINFSDFLRLPNMTLMSLWGMSHLKPEYVKYSYKMSPFKNEPKLADIPPILIENADTIGGKCMVAYIPIASVYIFGPVTYLDIQVLKTPLNHIWLFTDIYIRAWYVSHEENIRYVEADSGMASPLNVDAQLVIEEFEEFNLNHPLFPCDDGDKVERCIDQCLEDLLYSQVTCRLPFMKNDSLEMCDTPDNFNKTFEIAKKLVRKRKVCQDKCPRRCYTAIHIMNAQVSGLIEQTLKIRVRLFDQKVQRIREYYWYTFSSLVADIGGSLGFFIDVTVLSLAEMIEVCVEISIRCISLRKQKRSEEEGRKKSSFWGFRITRRNRRWLKQFFECKTETQLRWRDRMNVGIVGCDRLSNRRVSKQRKVLWTLCLIVSTLVCAYQIYSSIDDYSFRTPNVRMITLKNESVKYPTITICPYRPFEYSHFIHMLFEQYRFEFNTSSNSSVPLADLINLSDDALLSAWNRTAVSRNSVVKLDTYCEFFMKVQSETTFHISFTDHYTIGGKCITIDVVNLTRFRGPATLHCLLLSNLPETKSEFLISLTFHNPEDDPRILDPHLAIPLHHGVFGVWSIHAKYRKFLNRSGFPCEDGPTVAKCRSNCYDKMLEERTSCRLPFMKNMSLKPCTSPAEFQQTMDAAKYILKNYWKNEWCNCARKCSEYIYGINRNIMRFPKLLRPIFLGLQFPNNIFLATEEYSQMTASALFANICGSLGLFLGFSALTVLEIIEALFLFVSYKRNMKLLRRSL